MHLKWYGLCYILGKIENINSVQGFRLKKTLIRVKIKLLSTQDISYLALIFISNLIFVVPPTKPHVDVKLLKVPHC